MPSSSALSALCQLFHEIASLGPLTTAIALSRSHSTLHGLLSIYLRKSFDTLLRQRISEGNILHFSTLLRETLAAISGSTVLHFVLRDAHWRPGDFDIYAPFGAGFAIVDWLSRHENYSVVSDGSNSFLFHPHSVGIPQGGCDWLDELPEPAAPAIRTHIPPKSPSRYGSSDAQIYRVYKLQRPGGVSSIDVIESTRPSFLPPIAKFHSTLVMNYLTPDTLVVLYPRTTFRREGILQFRDTNTLDSYDADTGADPDPDPNVDSDPGAAQRIGRKVDPVQKYKRRGFTLYSRPADLRRACAAACPARIRTHPDKWALEVAFGTASAGAVHSIVPPRSDAIAAASLYAPASSQDSWALLSAASSQSGQVDAKPSCVASTSAAAPRCIPPAEPSHKDARTDVRPMPTRPAPRAIMWSLLGPPDVARPRRGRSLNTCNNPYCPLRGRGSVLPDSAAPGVA